MSGDEDRAVADAAAAIDAAFGQGATLLLSHYRRCEAAERAELIAAAAALAKCDGPDAE